MFQGLFHSLQNNGRLIYRWEILKLVRKLLLCLWRARDYSCHSRTSPSTKDLSMKWNVEPGLDLADQGTSTNPQISFFDLKQWISEVHGVPDRPQFLHRRIKLEDCFPSSQCSHLQDRNWTILHLCSLKSSIKSSFPASNRLCSLFGT